MDLAKDLLNRAEKSLAANAGWCLLGIVIFVAFVAVLQKV